MARGSSNQTNFKRLKKDFNTLFQYSESDKLIYRTPVEQDIHLIYEKNLVKNSDQQLFSCSANIEEFMIFGPGIYLLFKLLKLLIPTFAIMSLLTLPNLIILASGSYYAQTEINSNTFQAAMAKTTLGNIDQSYHTIIPLLYLCSLTAFTAAVVYWLQRQPYEVIECCKVKLLPSYYTVRLVSIPNGYSELQIKELLEKEVGPVREIFSVKDFKEDLCHYKEISEIIQEYKIQRWKVDSNRDERNCLKLLKLFNQFYQYYIKMNVRKNTKYQPAFAFITFSNVAHRELLLDHYQEKNLCQNCYQGPQKQDKYLFKGQKLKFQSCQIEPDGINWQNISLSTQKVVLRMVLQTILILIALVISISIIYLLALTQSNILNSQYQNYSLQQAVAISSVALQYTCLNLSISDFIRQQFYCSQYQALFIKVVLFELFLPLIISLLKFVFVQIMKSLVTIRRHPTQISKLQSQIIITFIFYFIVSGILQLAISIQIVTQSGMIISINQLFSSLFNGFSSVFQVSNGPTQLQNGFNRQWFFDNSAKVILISLLSFNLSSFIDIMYSLIRKEIVKHFASTKQTVAQMNVYLKCENLQIEFIYAFVLNIIFFTLLFGSVMPLLWIFSFLSIVILYFVNKIIFVRYCQKPLIFSHTVNHLVTKLILLGIVFSCVTTPLLYGDVMGISSIGQRYIKYLYYPILGLIILLYISTKRFWIRFFTTICQLIVKQAKRSSNRLPTIFSRIQKSDMELPSYSMHESKDYQPILKVLYTIDSRERNRRTFFIDENITNFLAQINQLDRQVTPFKSLLYDIKYDELKHKRSNFRSNSFSNLQKDVKIVIKLSEQTKMNRVRTKRRKQSAVSLKIEQNQIPKFEKDQIIEDGSISSDSDGQPTSRRLSKQQNMKLENLRNKDNMNNNITIKIKNTNNEL